MSSVTATNATVDPQGVVVFEYDGVIRAQLGSELLAATITGTITTTQIADSAISTPKLAAGAVIASKIAVAELSAITANIGTVTAGVIKGVTIEGGIIKTLSRFVLKEASATEIPEESAVVWGEPPNELIGGRVEGSQHILELKANLSTSSTLTGQITFKAFGKAPTIVGQKGALTQLSLVAEGAEGSIKSTTRPQNSTTDTVTTFIDSELRSHFPRMISAARRFLLSGAVSSAGAKLNGEGFTCERTAKGNYKIKASPALSTAGSLFLEVNGPFTQIHKASGPSTTEWTILINGFNGLGGGTITLEAADEAFSFFVLQH